MNRRIIYAGAIPTDLDAAQAQQFAMVALGFLTESVMGGATGAFGLAATPTAPASLSITIGRGALWSTTVVDQTAPGTAAIADSADPLVKTGINLFSTTLTFVPPATSGQSQAFLVQAQMSEQDTVPLVLPYYNASNPSQPFAGQANGGASQNTIRAQTVAIQVVAGAPASTGSQTIPAATTGWTPLWVVTLANGASTITGANIAAHPAAPFVPFTLPQLAPGFSRQSDFQTSGSFTVPNGVTRLKARLWGGGGGGGGAGGSASAGTGGTAGGYCEAIIAVTPGTTITATVGAAGVAGGGDGSSGTNGGTTSFGTLQAFGGNGGPGSTSGASTWPASPIPSGGSAAGGSLNLVGAASANSYVAGGTYFGSSGGAAPFAQGSAGITVSTGFTGGFPGGGGGGAACNGTPHSGGAGAAGMIRLEY